MMTIRSHDQFNTTIYGLDDRYRGIYQGRRVVLMNKADMDQANLNQGDWVDLVGVHQKEKRIAPNFMVVDYPIPQRCVATYFPEANVLVPINSFEPTSKTPASKKVVIRIEKVS
jgi:anaerobic selenocysteine-containing dehydrogenase